MYEYALLKNHCNLISGYMLASPTGISVEQTLSVAVRAGGNCMKCMLCVQTLLHTDFTVGV